MFKRSEQYSLERQRWMTFLSSTALVVFCKFTITSGCGGAKSKVRLIKPGKTRVQCLCQFSLFGNVFKVRSLHFMLQTNYFHHVLRLTSCQQSRRQNCVWCVCIKVNLCPQLSFCVHLWVSICVHTGQYGSDQSNCNLSQITFQERLAVLIVLLIQYCLREGNCACCFLRQNFPRFLFTSCLARL